MPFHNMLSLQHSPDVHFNTSPNFKRLETPTHCDLYLGHSPQAVSPDQLYGVLIGGT